MRVLFVANKSEFGGAPKCMLELIDLLTKSYGVEAVVVTYGKNVIANWCKERNILCYAVGHVPFAIGKGSTPFRRFAKTILTPLYYVWSYIQNKRAFQKACEIIDFDDINIIHTNSNRDCLGAILAKKYKIPHVWHLREFGKEDYDIRYLMWNYISFMNSTTDYFIAISEAVKKAWIEKGLDREKVFRLYDGINLPTKEVVNKAEIFQNTTDKEIFRFVYLGIVCPSKGQFDAVKALSYLEKDIVKKIHIDFWGDCECLPEFTEQLKRYARECGFIESISFRGFTDNIWNELPNYNGALVCSRSEAFGRITPEYMSLGLQVIASDTGANPELVEDGVSGYIYKHDDLRDLASKIEKVYLKNEEDRVSMACNAKKRAEQFSDSAHAEKVYNFYNKILELH